MKNFVKYTLASLCGTALFSIGAFVFSILLFSALGAIGNATSSGSLQDHSILRIKLDGELTERSQPASPFSSLMGDSDSEGLSLEDLVLAIDEAKTNDKIDGIYLEGGAVQADFASLQYLHDVLLDFKKSGKKIVAYADQYSQGSYYIASVADTITLNPSGMVDWHGIASQPIFYTGLLEKVGVKMQVFKVGTYKSAVEPYILTGMSDANREQVNSFVTDIWGEITKAVAKSRKLSVAVLNQYADDYVTLGDPKELKKMKLIDRLCYIDGVRTMLAGVAEGEPFHLVSASDIVSQLEYSTAEDAVAVYYAQGDIVDAALSNSFQASSQIVGSKVVEDLDALAQDDAVKAVVLRINSGGGSAYASEQMWRAIQLLKRKKPVVVSMSGMAASGGYYMSCGANYIYAEPTTITGSIGIFGMIPDASGLLKDKLGLSFDVVKTNRSSDFGAMGRSFNAEEGEAMQQYINRGYQLFMKRVADGRTAAGHKMTVEDVDRIAQGRVWTGNQALKLGLVDKLGSLDEAISKAARLAKLNEDYRVDTYPGKSDWLDQLLNENKGDEYLEKRLQSTLGAYYEPLQFVLNADQNSMLQARMFYLPNLK